MGNRVMQIADAIKTGVPSGVTLQRIADLFGVSRERVRQIGNKFNLPTSHRPYVETYAALQKRLSEDRYFAKNGISRLEVKSANEKYGHRIRDQYVRQRNNARSRGVEWNLKFGDWWRIWEPHYDKRGRGYGLAMCRYMDVGAYEVGNVYIASCAQNSSDYQALKKILAFQD